MEIEILNASNSKSLGKITVQPKSTIKDVKQSISKLKKGAVAVERQSIRLGARDKNLDDKTTVESLNLDSSSKLYVKDLGPQIGWRTVFLVEYAGPFFVYLWVYTRPWIFYGTLDPTLEVSTTANIAAFCWSFHYLKRIYETLFVHRFSHATMPLRNLFKNCSYYWLFTMYVAYHVNHPLYTPPPAIITYLSVIAFLLFEYGNYSIHVALRDLRPPGSTVRKIPMPTSNPFTFLFNFVSCPNYTYEVYSWMAFSVITFCLPAGLFTLAGAYQMTVWALGKHRAYKREFPNYPKKRTAIWPFIL